MNRKKVDGPKKNDASLQTKTKHECESNSTDSFDMNDFATSSLTKKYSVRIHKNNADLMAELNNIMGDESDCEIVEPNGKQNGLNTSANSSDLRLLGLNTTHSTGDDPDDDLASEKQERILAWAQSQSQNLSMCVASVLSDHDYLSQELLLGIVAGNEENTEMENKRKMNGIVQTSEKEPNEQNSEIDATQRQDGIPSDTIDNLSSILKQLAEGRGHVESMSLLEEIATKAKQMSAQLSARNNKDSENNSALEFSPNHSEPLEYYGDIKFSTQSSCEEQKESEGVDLLLETTNDLKYVGDMADRIKIDTLTIRNKLMEIEQQSEAERQSAIEKLRENFGLLVEDMIKELTKIGNKFRPNVAQNDSDLLVQLRVQRSRSRSSSEISGEVNSDSESRRKLKRLKKRRRLHKNQNEHSDSTNSSSNSDAASTRRNENGKPFVISQNIDDVMNGNANSNSANESIRKENDFLGFDDNYEIDIKQEAILNESISSLNQLQTSQHKDTQNATETSNQRVSNVSRDEQMSVDENEDEDKDDERSTQINEKDNVKPESEKTAKLEQSNRAAQDDGDSDHSSSTTNLSDDLVDEEDEDVRKLCDLKSLTNKRTAPTAVAPKLNGVVEPKKPTKKAAKEDEMAKFLANSDDTDKPIESDDEKSDREEITEEQFLKEQNRMLKEQLLEDSDSELDSDSERPINGDGSDFNSDLDSDHSSNSERSLVEKFLASSSQKGKADAKIEEKPKPSANMEKPAERKTKELPQKSSATKKDVEINDDDSDSDVEFDDGLLGSESEVPKKAKPVSTVPKRVFSSIDKEKHILIPSDDEDMSASESKERSNDKQKSEADSSEKGAIVDSTMFKPSKKDFTPNQLSKIIQSNRNKPTASRPSPECISVSSDDDFEEIDTTMGEKKDGNDDEDEEKKKRVARKLLRPDQLADDTKQAQKEESDRIKRLDKKNERLSQFLESQRLSQEESEDPVDPNEVILDFDSKRDEKVAVHPGITKHLKAHQVEGIKFMYDCCYGSVDNLDKFPGSGCILAHCMGLGKTLQLITLLHTVICYPQLKTDKVLVICPKSTVMNWKEEIERWLGSIRNTRKLKLFHFPEQSDVNSKLHTLKQWSQCGKEGNKQAGCLLLGYEAFRVLVFYHNSKKSRQIYGESELEGYRNSIHKYLLDPGADLVVCDEGHMIKNQKSSTSMAVNKILTKRRIVLTGTPIQNNLKEYWSMVNFIKPSFLGTEKEFANLYINPIKNGQHKDSSKSDIKHMKQRSYVLHKKLSKFVQRKEAALLKSFLPEKYEFVLFIPMTKIQEDLYEYFLINRPKQDSKGKTLIPDYTVLRKIWTHPKVLENAYLNALNNKNRIKPPPVNVPVNDSDDDQPDDVYDSKSGEMSVTNDWWRPHLSKDDLETILSSNKLKILFEILKRCERNKEKCLIFSAFVAVLDVVEQFMRLINDQETKGNQPGLETYRGRWVYGEDYYRLDGKTQKNHRHSMITSFNNPKNERTRVFLISAKAGGQGINLIGANRVILLDTSWNPSNDQQNIFRVFRLGQKRVCYIYRLISLGTMEETVYSRSVTKQAMSCRVMDEQQIDRHYSMSELTELYTLTKPDWDARPTPNVPKDDLLAQLLMQFPRLVYKYHEHDSLLENKGEEELSEQEKNDAWALYEADVKRKNETNFGPYNNSFGMYPNYSGLGTYANSLFNNYSNLSGVSGLNYPYNMYSQYNPYGSDYNQMRFNDYSAFYNNLMNIAGPSMSNYNPNNPSLLSPTNSSSVSSPPPNMNNFPSSSSSSSRNWMQSNASSNYANNLLSSLAQSSSSSKSGYSSYLNSLYNALGTPASSTATANATTSKTPPLPMSTPGFDPIAYLQKQQMLSLGAANPSASTSPLMGSSSAQGPNAQRNPLLTKELLIPRNPTMANPKELFNLPIPTSVITKSTTSPLSTITATLPGSSNEVSKSSSKSPDGSITSTVEKIGNKSTKSPTEPQISVKNVTAINNGSRESPDTTGNQANSKSANKSSHGNDVSSTVTVDSTKKTNNKPVTPVSSNMGIVYPSVKTTQIASTSKASLNTAAVLASSKPKEKDSTLNPLLTSSNVILTKSPSQPMPSFIRKPVQMNATKANDPTNDAVAAINKNKALTVTARSVNSPAAKVTPVSNSITVSPILNLANKSSGVTITPQPVAQPKTAAQGRTMSPLASSPIPIAITKVTSNQTSTTTKSPTTVVKPNVLSSRNTNTAKTFVTIPKTTNATTSSPTTSARVLNNNQPVVLQATQRFTPIIAQTKAKALAQTSVSPRVNRPANNSNLQVNRVQSLPQGLTVVRQKAGFNRPNVGVTMVNAKKRLNNDPIILDAAKRPRTSSNLIASGSAPGPSKSMNPLSGLRLNKAAASQPKNSQIVPVEIVELE